MAKVDTVTAKGASGTSYAFDVYPWGEIENKRGGAVYRVYHKKKNGNYTALYVGQTGDLSERFDDHHKAACFKKNARTHIGILLESSEKKRLAIEADLIANYNPVCNG